MLLLAYKVNSSLFFAVKKNGRYFGGNFFFGGGVSYESPKCELSHSRQIEELGSFAILIFIESSYKFIMGNSYCL